MFFALCIVFCVITYRNCRRSIMEFYKLQMHRLCPWPVILLHSLVLCWVDKLTTYRFGLFVCGVHLLLSTVGLVALFCFFWFVCLYIAHFIASLFFLQSQKQLKQQQEEKTNKAPVKQRLNQNKFYVSVRMQRCATDAHTRKNTNICAETRPGRKVSQEVYHGCHPVLNTVASVSPVNPCHWFFLVQSQLSTSLT